MAGARQAQQWLLTLLPAFPVLLLVLRLWQLSRQDMSTMLLLVQYVSPLGLLSALLIALVWAFPLVVLMFGVLGRLLRLSAPERFDPDRSLLASWTARTPGWVATAAVALGALTWQLRFLPTLLMLALCLLALRTRYLYPDQPNRILLVSVAIPLAVAVLEYAALAPAAWAALHVGEPTTAVLLVVPPAATVLLTGAIPGWIAPAVTHGLGVRGRGRAAAGDRRGLPGGAGAAHHRGRGRPTGLRDRDGGGEVAPEVVLGALITVTDTSTIMLDRAAVVRFLPNDHVRSQVLCPQARAVPYGVVAVHGWPVEETVLDWMMLRRPVTVRDVRCDGRLPAGDQRGRAPR